MYFVLGSVTFAYDLLEVDKPMFGGTIFPDSVVRSAVMAALVHGTQGLLELCRYESWPAPLQPAGDELSYDTMTAKLSESGRMLEVIGYVQQLGVTTNGVLRASGEMQDGLIWHLPLEGHVAVPYVDMRVEYSNSKIRVVKSFVITEVVLVYQAVTKLALRKYAERKSMLSIDTKHRLGVG